MHTKKHAILGIGGLLMLMAALALLTTSQMLKTDAVLISAKWTKDYVRWTNVQNATTGPRGFLVKNNAEPETYGTAHSEQTFPADGDVLLSFGYSGRGFVLAGFEDPSAPQAYEEHATYSITTENGKAEVRHGTSLLTSTSISGKDRFQIELQRDNGRIVYRKNGRTFFTVKEDTRKTLTVKAFLVDYRSSLNNVVAGVTEPQTPVPSPTPLSTITPIPSATPTPTSTPTPTPSAVGPTPTPPTGSIGGVELPRVYLNTSVADTPSTGQIRTVVAGGDLQATLNAAQPGDKIVLTAGATYKGAFILPAKSGNAWITITTAGFAIPEGKRVGPGDASSMAKITSPTVEGAISTATGAHHYRFIGVEFKIADDNAYVGDANSSNANTHYGLVRLGDTAETVLANQAHDFVLDRVYIHGHPTKNLRRCVALNSGSTAIVDSYLSECHEIGSDSQAIAGWNGPGPFKIVNNYLEGAGENIIFGGADSAIANMNPTDIEIRGNHFKKPLTWMQGHPSYAGYPWTIKNLFELKTAVRTLIDGNVFENSWPHGQTGMAINLKSSNQDGGAPWAITQDVTFTNNIVKNAPIGMTVHGRDQYNGPTLLMNKVRIANNVFDNLTAGPVSSGGMGGSGPDQGRFIQVTSGTKDVTFDHNTILNNGTAIVTDDVPAPNFTFTNNILNLGPYGIKGDGVGSGNETIVKFFPNSTFAKNAMVGSGSAYPTNNFYPANYAAVGFMSYNNGLNGNYRLAANSAYKNAGTDGKDLGADIDALTRATGCAVSGTCSGSGPVVPTPLPTPPIVGPTPPPAIPTPTPIPTPVPTQQPTAPTPTAVPTSNATVTVNGAQRYQTMNGWEAVAQAGALLESDMRTGRSNLNPAFANYKDSLFDQAVNNLGLNRLRLETFSGAENPTDYFGQYLNGQLTFNEWKAKWYQIVNDNSSSSSVNGSGFQFSQIDFSIDNYVLPIKQRLEAKGEQLFLNFCYVDFGNSSFEHYNDANEYAEFMLASFQHMQSKYGFVPNTIEIQLEPDNYPWNGTQIGQAMQATVAKLTAAGFSPKFVLPSTTSINNTAKYFDDAKNVVGNAFISQYVEEISYHLYGGADSTSRGAIKSRANQYGIKSSQLEYIGANVNDLVSDLKEANVSAWAQYTMAYPDSPDDGGHYYMISGTTVTPGSRTKKLAQYFKYVRRGAVRVGATSANGNFDPVAFQNANGKYVVVVNAPNGGSFSVGGLPAGTYGITYASGSQSLVPQNDVTITNGQAVSSSVSNQGGVVTIHQK